MGLTILVLPLLCLACVLDRSSALTDAEKQIFADNGVTISDSSKSGYHKITTDNDPDHAIGDFPNSDNPNDITVQNIDFEFPKSPSIAEEVSCVPQGPVMLAVNGVVMYSTYNARKEDANEVEVFDDCKGHPDNRGVYHYHQNPSCVYSGGNDELVGVALDGFPIYGPKDADGNTLTSADLDICHGTTVGGQYRYHITADFPYTLGCLKGEVTITNANACYCALASNYVGKSDDDTCEEGDDDTMDDDRPSCDDVPEGREPPPHCDGAGPSAAMSAVAAAVVLAMHLLI